MPTEPGCFISPTALLAHWHGHRRLTRRIIESFPDEAFATFTLGGMRPFGELANELLLMAEPMVRGAATGDWNSSASRDPKPKQEVLRLWDDSTVEINRLWPQIPAARFAETVTAFGQYTGTLHDLILYVIDNEIHHRGQAYVYLRALGVAPPPFYERS